MALTTKSDITTDRYWEANRYLELALLIGRTETGNFSETSTTSGQTYSGTGGEDELLEQLEEVLRIFNISAADWNAITTEFNTVLNDVIPPIQQDLLEIKSKLDQEGIIDFAKQTGYGAFFTFEDTEGINTGSTTATINTTAKQAEFNDTGAENLVLNNRTLSNEFTDVSLRLYPSNGVIQGESDGDYTNVNAVDLLSPSYTLTTDNSLWINNSEVGITNVEGGSTVIDVTTPEQLLNQADSTQGNGGRKHVLMPDGTDYAVTYASNVVTVTKRLSDGTKSTLCTIGLARNIDPYIDTDGTYLYINGTNGGRDKMAFWIVDPATQTNVDLGAADHEFTGFTGGSVETPVLGMNEFGGLDKITLSCSGIKATHPNSKNIWAVQGTISNGVVTFGSVEQLTTESSSAVDITDPTVVYKNDNNPIVIYSYNNTSVPLYRIDSRRFNGSTWAFGIVYNGSTHIQSNPSATFMPPSIATKINASYTSGLIIVAWHGRDATDSNQNNIRCRASSDGASTWFDFGVTNEKITSGNLRSQNDVTVAWSNDGTVHFAWHGDTDANPGFVNIRGIKRPTGGYGSVFQITTNYTDTPTWRANAVNNYHDFEDIIIIYSDNPNSDVKFYGKWTVGGAFNLTLASNVTLTDGQQVPILGVFTPTVNTQEMDISDVTDEYYYYEESVTSMNTLSLNTLGNNVNLDILTYSLG